MPPETCLEAQAVGEGSLEHSVEGHPWQWVARLASRKASTGGFGPDLEEFLGCNLIGSVPVRNARACTAGQDLECEANVFLEFDPLPVLRQLSAPALHLERSVVVLTTWQKQRGEHVLVALLPSRLVTLHELLDVHV